MKYLNYLLNTKHHVEQAQINLDGASLRRGREANAENLPQKAK